MVATSSSDSSVVVLNVLVIEDSPGRMHWLRQHVAGKSVNVIWTEHPDHFKAAYNAETTDLVILDFDLGEFGSAHLPAWEEATFGPMSSQSCCEVIDPQTPVVIWSMNPEGSLLLEHLLKKRDVVSVRIPYDTRDTRIIKVIMNALQLKQVEHQKDVK